LSSYVANGIGRDDPCHALGKICGAYVSIIQAALHPGCHHNDDDGRGRQRRTSNQIDFCGGVRQESECAVRSYVVITYAPNGHVLDASAINP
jgi:hypothetical protein